MLIEKVWKKIDGDYKKLEEGWLSCSKQALIRSAYEIAHASMIMDFFNTMDENYTLLETNVLENILNYEGNAVNKIWTDWLNYNHPERYNFFEFEDLADIISYSFKN